MSSALKMAPRPGRALPLFLFTLSLAMLLTGVPWAQEAQTPTSTSQETTTRTVEPTFTVQAERNLLTVRVVVRNKKGETVDNLRQEDFQVFLLCEYCIDRNNKFRGRRNVAFASYVTDAAHNGLDIVYLLLNLLIYQGVNSLWPVGYD